MIKADGMLAPEILTIDEVNEKIQPRFIPSLHYANQHAASNLCVEDGPQCDKRMLP